MANSVLTITLFTFPILSANAIEKTNYDQDHSSKSYGEVTTLIAADSQGSNSGSKSSDNGFLSKHTTEIEFTFAIMTIIAGLFVSEIFQRNQG